MSPRERRREAPSCAWACSLLGGGRTGTPTVPRPPRRAQTGFSGVSARRGARSSPISLERQHRRDGALVPAGHEAEGAPDQRARSLALDDVEERRRADDADVTQAARREGHGGSEGELPSLLRAEWCRDGQ